MTDNTDIEALEQAGYTAGRAGRSPVQARPERRWTEADEIAFSRGWIRGFDEYLDELLVKKDSERQGLPE